MKDLDSQSFWRESYVVHAPLSIAYVATGNQPQAAEQMRLAAEVYATTKNLSNVNDDFPDTPWFDLVEFNVLFKEASTKIDSSTD